MNAYKNIFSLLIKIIVGIASFYLIYVRLKNDFTPDKLVVIQRSFTDYSSYFLLIISLLFVPLNWGIESYKWQLITAPVEKVSFITSSKSVYSGLCVGNLAPGRATEFLAKIVFFNASNRPTITLLHFANGMFQLSVTIVFGLLAVFIFYQNNISSSDSTTFLLGVFFMLLLGVFTFFIVRFSSIQQWLIKKFERSVGRHVQPYTFSRSMITKLFLFSVLRYIVFTSQFVLLIKLFYPSPISSQLIAGISIYFLLTTILPMISLIEAAIRSAVALLVFTGTDIPEIALVLTAILLWVLNIVIPSSIGYFIIIREKLEFSFFKKQ